MSHQQVWPDVLWVVRHGESAGNVARDAALAARHHEIDVAMRDVDVPLSALGERQARALGHWFGQMAASERPGVILTSPYVRACRTAELVRDEAGLDDGDLEWVVDERLREKEFGTLDRLTRYGIRARFPAEAARRMLVGKFYHRPPGGESWCDVILRLRSVVDTISREYTGERVLVVCHAVVVMGFRYLLEHMTEAQILEIDRADEVANCAVTQFGYDPSLGKQGRLALVRYNFVAPMHEEGTPVTTEPDANVAAR